VGKSETTVDLADLLRDTEQELRELKQRGRTDKYVQDTEKFIARLRQLLKDRAKAKQQKK
jgi:hypothetical protein